MGEGAADNQAARRVVRHLNGQLVASRTAYVGPDLSHRRTLMTEVLRGRGVRAMVAQEAADKKVSRRDALLVARGMFEEIAADYSHTFVRLMERALRRLWTRIYDGVYVANVDALAGIATGSELVYVPCHRSTMDDLLMPYAIYTHGFAVPHIAAGINLNLPVVGSMMRKGGAFFLRRSFRGSALYSAVFTRYLAVIMARGHPIQYFIEGGRSRSGRSLAPITATERGSNRWTRPLRRMLPPNYRGFPWREEGSCSGRASAEPEARFSWKAQRPACLTCPIGSTTSAAPIPSWVRMACGSASSPPSASAMRVRYTALFATHVARNSSACMTATILGTGSSNCVMFCASDARAAS